jgi:hypothetical protein
MNKMDTDQEDEEAGFAVENSKTAFFLPSFICVHPVHLWLRRILSLA